MMMDQDLSSRRRARRARSAPTVSQTVARAVDPFEVTTHQSTPSAYQLLGVRPGATKLHVVKGYQRSLRYAETDDRRRALAAAFRKLGAQPIRTYCPYGHDLVLYALDGDTHSAYCATCYNEVAPYTSYKYIGWASCLKVSRVNAGDMHPNEMPNGEEPVKLADLTVVYRTPVGDRASVFTMDATVPMQLGPGDAFTVMMRGEQPWRLLNHSSATSSPLDALYRFREQLDRSQRSAETRAKTKSSRRSAREH